MDCDKYSQVCESEDIGDFPTIRIYFSGPTINESGDDDSNNNNIYSVDYEGNEIYSALSNFLDKSNVDSFYRMDKKRKFIDNNSNSASQVHSGSNIVHDTFQNHLDAFELRLKKWLAKGLKKMEKRITEKISRRFKQVVKNEL